VLAAAGLCGVVVLGAAACAASPPAPARLDAAHVATAALRGRQHAELDVTSGTTSLTIRTARLHGQLLRVSTPVGAGVRPRLSVGDVIRLGLASTGTGGPAVVRVTLNSAVAWRLWFAAGTSRTAVYLRGAVLRGAVFAAGSSRITLQLPRPHGTVPIVLAGGASRVAVADPAGVPARLSLIGGAGHASIGGRAYVGIAGGTVLTAPGWSSAVSRYDITAPAGVGAIQVTS
jgi:hypothetical protein